MSKMKDFFVSSAKELKVTQNMVICAMMAALAIVLNYTTSISIPIINSNIGFSGIPNRIKFLFFVLGSFHCFHIHIRIL